MLVEKLNNQKLEKILIPQKDFTPHPRANDRYAWDNIKEGLRANLIKKGESYLDYSWPHLPALRYMDFSRNGNRTRYQKLYKSRRNALSHLVYAECLENKGRFIDEIINGIWAVCEESSWCYPAHNKTPRTGLKPLPDVKDPIIDLFAAETAALLSWTHYLLNNELNTVTDMVTERIELEVDRRIFIPFLERTDFPWMGFSDNHRFNNWTTWILSNIFTTFLLLEKEKSRRISCIEKGMVSLDGFLNHYKSDGGCDEGPSYWDRAGGSLFDCLELLYSASEGRIDFYEEPLIQNIGKYIYKVHIDGEYFINFADCGCKPRIDPYLAYRFGQRINDQKLCRFALYMKTKKAPEDQLYRGKNVKEYYRTPGKVLRAIFTHSEMEEKIEKEKNIKAPLIKNVWMPGIQIMAARKKKLKSSVLYLAAKGGHNRESHNHNDVGNFIVYMNSHPFIIDVGVETYSRKTFSSRRYEIWTMQSAYHNLPTINSCQQQAGISLGVSRVRVRLRVNIKVRV